LKASATTGKSLFGNTRIRSIDMEAFTKLDNEAAARFTHAIVTESRRLVQVNDPTQYGLWMHSDLGKLATNLQKYNIVAYQGKTLRKGLEFRNGEYGQLMSTMLMTSAAAAAMYITRTYYQSIGRPDREKFLKQRLADGAWWKNGIARSDYASLLPGVVQIPYGLVKEQGPFAYKSTTGRSASIVAGIPAVDLGQTLYDIRTIPFNGLNPHKQLTRGELRSAAQLVPDFLNVRNAIEWYARRLPRSNDQGKP
jgi:hypothetical protein